MPSDSTPTPWHVEAQDVDGSHSKYCSQKICDSRGRTIVDTLNSEVAVIESDSDEDGYYVWDEQGRVDADLIVEAVNSYASLRAIAEAAERLSENLHRQIVSTRMGPRYSFQGGAFDEIKRLLAAWRGVTTKGDGDG